MVDWDSCEVSGTIRWDGPAKSESPFVKTTVVNITMILLGFLPISGGAGFRWPIHSMMG